MARPHRRCRSRLTPLHLGGDVHYGEAAGGRIDNEITGLCDGADQPRDQIEEFACRWIL
jgi:hypothetical protein